MAGPDLQDLRARARGRKVGDAAPDDPDQPVVQGPVRQVGAAEAVVDVLGVVGLLMPLLEAGQIVRSAQLTASCTVSMAAWTWLSIQG